MRVLRFSSTEDVNRGGNFFSMGHTCQGGRTRLCSCLSIAESPEAMCTKEQRAFTAGQEHAFFHALSSKENPAQVSEDTTKQLQ